jgi:hypothetical protein
MKLFAFGGIALLALGTATLLTVEKPVAPWVQRHRRARDSEEQRDRLAGSSADEHRAR